MKVLKLVITSQAQIMEITGNLNTGSFERAVNDFGILPHLISRRVSKQTLYTPNK